MIWPHLWVGLLMTWTRLWRLRVVKVCLVSDCNGLSKWIFISPTRQTNPGRLFTLSRRSGSCSVNIDSVRLFHRFGGGRYRQKKWSVLCCKVIDACTTLNDVWVKSKFVLNVMLEPKVDLYTVAIPPLRDRDWRGNDFTSNPLGANSTVFASSPWTLSHVSVTKKRSTPLSFINADISQRLQAISLPFTDCVWSNNEATMNECKCCFFLFTPRLERWRRGRWYPMFTSLYKTWDQWHKRITFSWS